MASLGGWCYHLSQAQMPWAASRLACQALGGQLSSITSSEEDLVVAELAREAKSAVWTGGCQESSRAGWKWEDGSRWRFTRWPSCEEHTRCTWGEPAERGCLVVSQSGWQVQSMDYVCTILGCYLDDAQVEDPSEPRRFVCRIKERMEGEFPLIKRCCHTFNFYLTIL